MKEYWKKLKSSKILRAIKPIVPGVVLIISAILFGLCFISTILNMVPLDIGLLATIGWGISWISITIAICLNQTKEKQHIIDKINVYKESEKIARQAYQVIEEAIGYNERFAENIPLYLRMVSNGVKVPIANALISFGQKLKESDTIFLIKVDRDSNSWTLQIAGHPIHETVVKNTMDGVKQKCQEISKHRGFIWKPKNIRN